MKLNEAALKPEIIFISYDDVIRTSIPSIYKEMQKVRMYYEDFIDFSKIDGDTHTVIKSVQTRIYYNPLKALAAQSFEYDATLMSLTTNIDNIYKDSPDMVMGRTLNILAQESFIKKIYIYHPTGSNIIKSDIASIVTDNISKVEFLTGTLVDALSSMKDSISLYIVNDILMATDIITHAKSQCADILVANYGYNYKLSEDKRPILKVDNIENEATDNGFRLRMFMPFFKESIIPKD